MVTELLAEKDVQLAEFDLLRRVQVSRRAQAPRTNVSP